MQVNEQFIIILSKKSKLIDQLYKEWLNSTVNFDTLVKAILIGLVSENLALYQKLSEIDTIIIIRPNEDKN